MAVFKIFKSLAKFTLRRGMSVSAMNELVRRASLSAAIEIITEENSKVTTSRICAMTGMYRREVRRLEALPALSDQEANDKLNRSSRVVSGWLRDEDYLTKSGRPAALKLEGENGFDRLVRKYSGDITPTAIRQELERLGMVSFTKGGLIKLEKQIYLNSTEEDGITVLGTDTTQLIDTIAHNLDPENTEKYFQRKVSYINVPEHNIAEFHQYAEAESQNLLEKLDRWLSRLTRSSDSEEAKYQLGIGVFHFRSKLPDSSVDESNGNQKVQNTPKAENY